MNYKSIISSTAAVGLLATGAFFGREAIIHAKDRKNKEQQEQVNYTKNVKSMSIEELTTEIVTKIDNESLRSILDQVLAKAKNSPNDSVALLELFEKTVIEINDANKATHSGKFTYIPDKKPLTLAVAVLEKARDQFYETLPADIAEGDKARLQLMTKAIYNAQDSVNSVSDDRGLARS